ncbi:ATP-dependent RNA helicase RhlE [Chlamydiales bacterium SCGC AG-110-P3]|nr:ATP-dependent RNA helicase RhlE [Chlamydiales bacterium SCGC AG-110-P3]
MSYFESLELDKRLLKVLGEIGYKEPTPIQERAIPEIIAERDIVASAQTGSGKTGSFLLPLLHRLTIKKVERSKGPRVVVLVPTRELAIQVAGESQKYSKQLPFLTTVCIYGGVPYFKQKRMLARGCDVMVATPGRLIDLMEQGRVDLKGVETLVLDEADRMLDMGFIGPVEEIAAACGKNRQTLLFSATIDKKILRLSSSLQNDPVEIEMASEVTSDHIEQRLYYVDNLNHKMQLIDRLIADKSIYQAIVFTSTKRKADELADHFSSNGYSSNALHGDMNQRQRTRTIEQLRKGKLQILVATDVAARGIDVLSLTHVINFDLPTQAEDYVHRIGRTGRAGATGTAYTFATYREERDLADIARLIGSQMKKHTVEGLEPRQQSASRRGPRGSAGGRPGRPGSSSGYGKPRFAGGRNNQFGSRKRGDSPRRSGQGQQGQRYARNG